MAAGNSLENKAMHRQHLRTESSINVVKACDADKNHRAHRRYRTVLILPNKNVYVQSIQYCHYIPQTFPHMGLTTAWIQGHLQHTLALTVCLGFYSRQDKWKEQAVNLAWESVAFITPLRFMRNFNLSFYLQNAFQRSFFSHERYPRHCRNQSAWFPKTLMGVLRESRCEVLPSYLFPPTQSRLVASYL